MGKRFQKRKCHISRYGRPDPPGNQNKINFYAAGDFLSLLQFSSKYITQKTVCTERRLFFIAMRPAASISIASHLFFQWDVHPLFVTLTLEYQRRLMIIKAIIPQTTSITQLNIQIGIQPILKTNVRANAVHKPPPIIGS